MTPENAETIALNALGWIASDDDILGGFLANSGLGIDDIRSRAAEPEFLGAVLDYILSADEMVLAVAAQINIRPEAVLTARLTLPGGAQMHWT